MIDVLGIDLIEVNNTPGVKLKHEDETVILKRKTFLQ